MSGAAELVIDSATGVEVALPLAGAGGRAYAFVIDWHIRTAFALAWFGAGAALQAWWSRGTVSLELPFDPGPAWFLGVVLPTAAIYFLYHPVLEVLLRGRTPGKRIAGLRIVTREGRTPGLGALLVRNAFRLVDSFPALYCVGLVATLVTRQHVRIGDLAAGTVLVYERERRLPWRAGGGDAVPRVALAQVEVLEELLERWDDLAPASRRALACDLLGRAGAPPPAIDADDATLRARLAALAPTAGDPP